MGNKIKNTIGALCIATIPLIVNAQNVVKIEKDSLGKKITYINAEPKNNILTINAQDYNKDGKTDLIVFDSLCSIYKGIEAGKRIRNYYYLNEEENKEFLKDIPKDMEGFTNYKGKNTWKVPEKKEDENNPFYDNNLLNQFTREDSIPDFSFTSSKKNPEYVKKMFQILDNLDKKDTLQKKLYNLYEEHKKEYESMLKFIF